MLARKRLIIVAIAIATATCNETSSPNGDAAGKSRVLLTDAPFPYDNVERVDIFVVSLSVALGTDTSAGSPETFSTVATPNRKINLLALQGGLTDEIALLDLPEGAVKSVRLVIDTDQSSITMKTGAVLTGSSSPGIAWQSSAGKPTLNALVEDQIVVSDTGTTIVVDFDVGRAFIDPADVSPPSGHQGFIFSPVIRAAAVERTGSVSGLLRAGLATGAAVSGSTVLLKLGDPLNPENTWSTVATTRSDANGAFKFGYVARTALYTTAHSTWRYMVVAEPPAGSGRTRQIAGNIQVTAGTQTNIGVVILP